MGGAWGRRSYNESYSCVFSWQEIAMNVDLIFEDSFAGRAARTVKVIIMRISFTLVTSTGE